KRARYKLGGLQLLVRLVDGKQSSNAFAFWWNVGSCADTEDVLNFLLDNRIEITGAPHKMQRCL
ncbi:hypothetical protein, partial [Salmonella sp. s51884]|uniref:hypothetical protein n=1 Tax=Salmonella sp. s51884 TaxID=3159654 RepID=UPI00398142E0